MRLLAAVVPALLLAGCSASGDGRRAATTASTLHLVQLGSQHGSRVASQYGSRVAHARVERVAAPPANAVEWTVASVVPSSDRIAIFWTDGPSQRCGEVDHLRVFESSSSVAIGLTATRQGDTVCVSIGIPRRQTVQLSRPLGARALVEGTTGVNTGLPVFTYPDALPTPTCPTDDVRDVPVGFAGAAARLAPSTGVTSVTICRTDWPHGRVRSTTAHVMEPVAVRQLLGALAGVAPLHPAQTRITGCDRKDGAWYTVVLLGARLRVPVRVSTFDCTASNGAAAGTPTRDLVRLLTETFASRAG